MNDWIKVFAVWIIWMIGATVLGEFMGFNRFWGYTGWSIGLLGMVFGFEMKDILDKERKKKVKK